MKPQRINWLRIAALIFGALVFVAHIITHRPPGPYLHFLDYDLNDLAKHFALISAFTLCYRLSYAPRIKGATAASIIVCSGWAGMCEVLQHWIPARDFSVIELGVNTLTPVLIVGLLRLVRLR